MNIDIYKLKISEIGEEEYRSAYFLMSADRQKKCDAYKNQDDKKRCIAADFLLRRKLAERLGISQSEIEIKTAANGKPYIEEAKVCFSLSHAGDFIAVAISDGDLGVDIEQIRPVRPGTVRFFCSEADKLYIFNSLNTADFDRLLSSPAVLRRFFEVWTFKEAYYKCTGEGIGKYAAKIDYAAYEKFHDYPDGYVLCAVQLP